MPPATPTGTARRDARAAGARAEARPKGEPGFALVPALSREVDGRRIDRATAPEALARLPAAPRRTFVEAATVLLLDAGVARGAIRTERFG